MEPVAFLRNRPSSIGVLHKGMAPLLLLLVCGTSCIQSSVATPAPVTISIGGSTALLPVLFDVSQAFSKQHPNVVFDIRGGGSHLGRSQLLQGNFDLAATALLGLEEEGFDLTEEANRVLSRSESIASRISTSNQSVESGTEVVYGAEIGQGRPRDTLIPIPIALDGLAIIVHASNKLSDLTLTELSNIYSGRILDWSELGNQSGDIILISREENSSIRTFFEKRVMGNDSTSLTAVVMPTNAEVLRYTAMHPTAIGYISSSYVSNRGSANGSGVTNQSDDGPSGEQSIAMGNQNQPDRPNLVHGVESDNDFFASLNNERRQVKAIALEGRTPSIANISDQTYPLVYPLYLLSSGEPRGWRASFVDFVLGPSGQNIVGRHHAPIR